MKLIDETHDLETQNELLRLEVEGLRNLLADKDAEIEEFKTNANRAALQSLKAALTTHTRKLEAKNRELNQFIYAASHDLLEPVNTVLSAISVFEEEGNVSKESAEAMYLEIIQGSTVRMKKLIVALLDFSLVGVHHTDGYVNLNQIFTQVKAGLSKQLNEAGGGLRSLPLPIIHGNKEELTTLLKHLLENAIKFRSPDRKLKVEVSFKRQESFWLFSVKDNGLGIPEQYKDKVFELFQRLHVREKYDGLGTGLAFCWKIVNVHGGDIWINTLEQGTEVCFRIPR